MGYIYKITNKINNKVYIGQTSKTIAERFDAHLRHAANHVNRYLYDAMNFYGYENFTVESLEKCGKSSLDEREIYWISFYKSNNPDYGYNMTAGGGGGDTFALRSEESKRLFRENVSARQTGKKQDPETVAKRVAKLRGLKHSEESRLHMSEGQKKRDASTYRRGFTLTQESKDKISKSLTGQKQSEETKQKRKDSMSRLKWWNNGIECIRATECPDGYIAGRINFEPSKESKAKSSHKGTKWFTNGKENKMAYECPEGFWPGKTFKKDLVGAK